MEVKWTDYSYNSYNTFINKVVGEKEYLAHKQEYQILAELCSTTAATLDVVSPRLVKDAIDILKANSYDVFSLTILDGLNTEALTSVITHCELRNETSFLHTIEIKLNDYMDDILSDLDDKSITQHISELNYITKKLKLLPITGEDNTKTLGIIMDRVERAKSALWSKFDRVTPADKLKIDTLFNSD
jgi:hypothetical protein